MIRSTLFTANAGDYPAEELEAIARGYAPEKVANLARRAALYALWTKDGRICHACGACSPASGDGQKPSEETTFWVSAVFVSPQTQGRGCGRRIMDALENHAREQGGRRIRLNASITARGFYQSLGYGHLGDPHQPNEQRVFLMEKQLVGP